MRRSEDEFKDRNLKKVKLLSAEEEKELANRVSTNDKEAIDTFVLANLKLVAQKSGRIHRRNPWVPESDLIQDGILGLYDAVENFKPSKNFRFSTYAGTIIWRRMISGIYERKGMIYIPEEVQKARTKLNKGRYQFYKEFGYMPTHIELCEYLGIDQNMARTLEKIPTTISSDAMRQSRRHSILLDRVPDYSHTDPWQATVESIEERQLLSLIRRLDQRKRDILFRRFCYINGRPEALESIGKTWKLTKERIRQLQDEALDELRVHAGAIGESCFI